MNANLVLALLSKHPHLMYIELAVVTPISPSIANLSYIPKAATLPFSYLVIDIELSSQYELIIYNVQRTSFLPESCAAFHAARIINLTS
ncbi:Bgt-51062 [Blumeria graminis f. sp. tritici]|uniref:Bgt-51062 n=1 Tax=Blumeria graminis f. sp. tritici TaxID=62690 RepID=A0A9X9L9M2_BLUGR|nr:Bgt-51062 [Blumeria graminis f. sp. tritici]